MRKFYLASLEEVKRFTMHPRNRSIDRKHLQKIKKQMRESFAMMPAITVNLKTGHIIDGQHRWKAFLDLCEEGFFSAGTKFPVMFVEIDPADEFPHIVDANINNQGWQCNDYIQSYIKGGDENYIKLDNWARNNVLTANTGQKYPKYRYAAIMMKGTLNRKEIATGAFKVSNAELENATVVHQEILDILRLLGLPMSGQWIENMIVAWSKVRAFHKYSVWSNYFKTHKTSLKKNPMATVSDWSSIFNDVHAGIDKRNSDARSRYATMQTYPA